MKKNFVIILINLLLISTILIGVEVYYNQKFKNDYKDIIERSNKIYNGKTLFSTDYKLFRPFSDSLYRMPNIGALASSKSIILFGGSFAEGAGLENNQTFCAKMTDITGRTCYNLGKGATGTSFMYYQLTKDDIKKKAPDAEIIVYLFIWDHLHRLYNYSVNSFIPEFNIRYKIVNGKPVRIKPRFGVLYSSRTVQHIQKQVAWEKIKKEYSDFELFNVLMQESMLKSKKLYPNSRFIILEYPDKTMANKLPPSEIKKLKEMGFEVYNSNQLAGHELSTLDYKVADQIHPNEKAWNELTPIFVKKAHL